MSVDAHKDGDVWVQDGVWMRQRGGVPEPLPGQALVDQDSAPLPGVGAIGIGGVVAKAAAQAARYQEAIDNQKAIIDMQKARIMKALEVLEEAPLGGHRRTVLKAVEILKGQTDG